MGGPGVCRKSSCASKTKNPSVVAGTTAPGPPSPPAPPGPPPGPPPPPPPPGPPPGPPPINGTFKVGHGQFNVHGCEYYCEHVCTFAEREHLQSACIRTAATVARCPLSLPRVPLLARTHIDTAQTPAEESRRRRISFTPKGPDRSTPSSVSTPSPEPLKALQRNAPCPSRFSLTLHWERCTADGHGIAGGIDGCDGWLKTIASLGLVVVAPFTSGGACELEWEDMLLALKASREGGAKLHPALGPGRVDWSRTGVMGHSMGGMNTPTAASATGYNITAMLASHGALFAGRVHVPGECSTLGISTTHWYSTPEHILQHQYI